MINILDNNNSNNIAYFYPINLYLAGLYRKSFFKDLKYKKTSGFSYAYNCMSEKVKQNYLLYRTSHIVADTILSKILDTCYKLKKICKLQKKQLKEKEIITKNTKNSINEWNNRCRKVLKTKIDCLCDLLESELNSINSKKADKINKRIEEIIKRFCDNAQQELSVFIHEEINKLREELNTKYSNKIHEGFKNKDLLFNNSIQEFNENQHVIGAHEVLWGVGKVGVLAMFIPGLNVAVTGTLFITTIVLDIVSNKFTHSFSERRKEFNQKLDNFKKEIINTIKSELLKNTNKNIDDIVNYFLDATNQAYKYLEQQYYTFETNTSNHIEYLNDKLESMLYIYSLFFLSMQQPKAIFKNKYLIFEKEKPVLKINVNNGKNEIWSETYMQVEILNGD